MTEINPFDDNPKDELISVLDILIIITRNIKIFITVFFVILLYGIVKVNSNNTPIYIAKAKIISSSGGGSGLSGIASQFGISLPTQNSETSIDYPIYLKSRTFARQMLNRKFDTDDFGLGKPLLQILTYGNGVPTVGIDTLIQTGINNFLGMIEIMQEGSIYEIQSSNVDPKFAYDILVAIIEELNIHQKQHKSNQLLETRQFIEERLIVAEAELQNAEEALTSFSQRNRQIGNSPMLLLEQERLGRNVSVILNVFTTLKQQLESTKIEEVKISNSVFVFEQPEIPLYPEDPRKKKKIILFGIIGAIIGLILAFFKEYIAKSTQKDQEKLNELKSLVLMNIKWLSRLKNIRNKVN